MDKRERTSGWRYYLFFFEIILLYFAMMMTISKLNMNRAQWLKVKTTTTATKEGW